MDWVKLKDKLPEIGRCVLISDGEHIGHARLRNNRFNIVASNDCIRLSDVTHWMPLPTPPNKE